MTPTTVPLLLGLILVLTYLNCDNAFRYIPHAFIRPQQLHMSSVQSGGATAGQGPPDKGPDGTPLLDTVNFPSDMKRLSVKQLKQLSHELRWETINAVSKTGGHLGSSLGVVELTVALHYIFDAPEDKIIWDVAHQAYPHKILTGRRSQMPTLRQLDGISGFTNRNESAYDCFGAGHSSTSISAALGMSVGKILQNKPKNNCIAVIGDGAITGGMAYEAMNNAAYINSRVIVVLNDNGQVSLPTGQPSAGGVVPAGALSGYTSRLLTSNAFKNVRDIAKGLNSFMPGDIQNINKKVDEYVRGMATGGTLFEELGFYYVGPVDAHDLNSMVAVLENIRDNVPVTKPVLLHIKSTKGKGYPPAEAASDKYHGVAKFDVASGKQMKSPQKTASFTDVFAQSLIRLAETDRAVCGITAAMPGGTGIDKFGRRFPKRTFDVGIAEQHGVTFAAGMAVEGLKPFCAIYSTFMQRALDQLIHDVALQQLPVRFVLDRGGLVGNDGATHHGIYDFSYIGCVPDVIIMAPSDEIELQHMIQTQYGIENRPSVVRFPRGSGYGKEILEDVLSETKDKDSILAAYESGKLDVEHGSPIEIGKGRIIKPPVPNKKFNVAVLSIGTRLVEAVQAARAVEAESADISVTVADARFMKPLDERLVEELAKTHDVLLTIEEGSKGGFGAHVLHFMSDAGLLDDGAVKVRSMYIPDIWIEAGSQKEQYDIAQLNAEHITTKISDLVENMRDYKPRGILSGDIVTDGGMEVLVPSSVGAATVNATTSGGTTGSAFFANFWDEVDDADTTASAAEEEGEEEEDTSGNARSDGGDSDSSSTGSAAPLQQLMVRFDCDALDADEVSELLFECGCLSVSVEATSERPGVLNNETRWADLQKTANWATALLRATVPASFDAAGLCELLQLTYPELPFDIQTAAVEDIDWVQHVQKSWPPQKIAGLTVYFPWHDKNEAPVEVGHSSGSGSSADGTGTAAAVTPARHELTLEGGAAFGTGDHATTRLCCRWLQEQLNSKAANENDNDDDVLDYGCGSAILALAALKFGAKSAAGVDIDRDALSSARRNCEMNGLQMDLFVASEDDESDDRLTATQQSAEEQSVLLNKFRGGAALSSNSATGSDTAAPLASAASAREEFQPVAVGLKQRQFSIVLANIMAPILISLASELAEHTRSPGGKIALSGVFGPQSDAVIAAFNPYYDDMVVTDTEDGWVLITGTRK